MMANAGIRVADLDSSLGALLHEPENVGCFTITRLALLWASLGASVSSWRNWLTRGDYPIR